MLGCRLYDCSDGISESDSSAMMVVPTSRVAAVELRGFRSIQKQAKIHLTDASLTGIVGPNGMCTSTRKVSGHTLRSTLLCRKLVLESLGWSTLPHVCRQWQIFSPSGALFLLRSSIVPAGCQETGRSVVHRRITGTEDLAGSMLPYILDY